MKLKFTNKFLESAQPSVPAPKIKTFCLDITSKFSSGANLHFINFRFSSALLSANLNDITKIKKKCFKFFLKPVLRCILALTNNNIPSCVIEVSLYAAFLLTVTSLVTTREWHEQFKACMIGLQIKCFHLPYDQKRFCNFVITLSSTGRYVHPIESEVSWKDLF